MSGCGPHRCVCCHFVGADSDGLNNGRWTRYFVRCDSTRATCSASDGAEEITARAICGSRNTGGVLVADGHAGLDRVGGGLAAVRRVEGRTGEVLAAVDGVGGAVRVGVVPTAVSWAKSFGWRGDSRSGWRRNSSAATIRRRKVARRARRGCNTTVRRRRVIGWRWARCALSVRRRRVVRKRRRNATAAIDWRTTI